MKHKSGINDLYLINSYNTILYCTPKKIQESMHMFHKIISYIIKVGLRRRGCAKWQHQTEEILLDF